VKHPARANTTVIERLFEAVGRNDPERVLELVHPRAEWSPSVWSGDPMYRGEEGVHLWLSQFGEELEFLDIQVRDVESRGDRGAVRGIVFDTRGSQTFAVEVSWSFEMEEGLVRRGRAHGSWEEALGAARLVKRRQ
jgi:ketosteroid isomerase-like protein